MDYINSKCHISKLKSRRTCLIGYSGLISSEWFFIAQGTDTQTHTHINTDVCTKVISRNQACAWFKDFADKYKTSKIFILEILCSVLATMLFTFILENLSSNFCFKKIVDDL